MFKLLKYRFIAYIFSLAVFFSGLYYFVTKPLNFSTEFTGGTKVVFNSEDSIDSLNSYFSTKYDNYKLDANSGDYSFSLNTSLSLNETTQLKNDFSNSINSFNLVSLEVVEPSVGQELITKTFFAIGFSVLVIFAYVWYAFKNVLSSVSAIIAMLHDTFIIIGLFAIFGYYFNAEIDLLFVTAVLTVLSFSLYDTIVIFDKIRELYNKGRYKNYYEVINSAVSQTMVRSINNSLTSMLVLFSLSLFVTGTLFWFVVALFLGVLFGTYSSPFIAATLFYDIRTYVLPLSKKMFSKIRKRK